MDKINPNFQNINQLVIYTIIGILMLFWIFRIFLKNNQQQENETKNYKPENKNSNPNNPTRNADDTSDKQLNNTNTVENKLNTYLEYLIKKSWHGRIRNNTFEFSVKEADGFNDLSLFLGEVLKHVRRIAPNLEVPTLIPKVKFETLLLCAGQFLESDGWITISVDNRYLLQPRAAKAIMCHEICHYILNYNGIRYKEFLENEHLTEAAMFAFGLGEVFLAGYRFVSNDGKKHGVGYLSPNEYQYLRKIASDRWKDYVGSDDGDKYEKEFKSRIPDPRVRDRLLNAETKKYPNRSRIENIKNILEQYERDRR